MDTIKILRCHRAKRNDMQSSSFQATVEANLGMTVSVSSHLKLQRRCHFKHIAIYTQLHICSAWPKWTQWTKALHLYKLYSLPIGDTFCQVSLKLAQRFQRRCGLKANVDGRWTTEDTPLYYLTDGELKTLFTFL